MLRPWTKPPERFTLAPLNEGREPLASVMVKLSSGKESKTPRGSWRSLRVSSPVLVMVVVTLRSLAFGAETLRDKPGAAGLGAAETMAAAATRATREARREEENIVIVKR